ncbi:hypothetical protein, partial [Mesorhizobium sp. M7A.F.Ca.CA.001.05.1.1]|uniref:hypothetical protein n=1 Tax=Mesorhizobium sp. M7A.F.Ca.CA.001.05.1.1 TaxID=2496721 RepID=UPI0019D1D199
RTCSALADILIHKTASIGVSRKNIGTKFTKPVIPCNPQGPSRNPAAAVADRGGTKNMARN